MVGGMQPNPVTAIALACLSLAIACQLFLKILFAGVDTGWTVCVSPGSPVLYLVLCLFLNLALLPL